MSSTLSQPLDAVWGYNAAGVLLSWQVNPANPAGTLYAVKRWITASGVGTAVFVAQQISATTWSDPASIAKQDCTYQIFAQASDGTCSAQGWTVHGAWPGPATAANAAATSAVPGTPIAAISYPSDRWLATFPQDSSGFIDWQTFITQNAYTPVYIGTQAGDLVDVNAANAQAAALLAAGKPVAILFRRGQTYSAAQLDNNIGVCGKTPALPLLIGSTFDLSNPRPVLSKSLNLANNHAPIANVCYFGLEFYDPVHDPNSTSFNPSAGTSFDGIGIIPAIPGGSGYLLIEDCRIHCMTDGIEFQGSATAPLQTIIVRRCAIDHNWGWHYGVYTYSVQDFLLEQCVLDHHGWCEATATWAGYAKSMFCHNAYLQNWPTALASVNPQTRVSQTLFARAASDGCQQRSGGSNDGCVYIGNPIAGFVANTAGSSFSNAVVCGAGFDLSLPGESVGDGLAIFGCASGSATNIIFTDKQDAENNGSALATQAPTTVAASNLIVSKTWIGKAFDYGSPAGKATFSNCDLPGVMAAGVIPTPAYIDPTRSIAGYAASLGRSDITDAASFLTAACANRRGSYDARLTAAAFLQYVQAGFAVNG
jgi:hypothetical protein